MPASTLRGEDGWPRLRRQRRDDDTSRVARSRLVPKRRRPRLRLRKVRRHTISRGTCSLDASVVVLVGLSATTNQGMKLTLKPRSVAGDRQACTLLGFRSSGCRRPLFPRNESNREIKRVTTTPSSKLFMLQRGESLETEQRSCRNQEKARRQGRSLLISRPSGAHTHTHTKPDTSDTSDTPRFQSVD